MKTLAGQILGMQLVTHQTGPQGQKVRRLLIEEGADIKKEYYLGMVVDRVTQKVALMASAEGGMDIEEVAATHPEKIHRLAVDPATGIKDAEADDVARKIGIPAASVPQARAVLQALYRAFWETDSSLAEINPLILTGDGRVIALDAKMNFDDNALFRHPEIVAMRDLDEEDPAEVEASKSDLNYIQLDGNIGCLVNGAGLAMATMDIIKFYGGAPANFLDVGGGATTEKVTEAFKIMLRNPALAAILVNIFGGIMKCDVIATALVAAAKVVSLGCRSWCGSRARTSSSARRSSPSPGCRSSRGRKWRMRRRKSSPRRRANRAGARCRFSSTATPGSSPRASPGRPASSTPGCRATTRTGRTATSPASIRRRRARTSRASRSSPAWRRRKRRPASTRR